MILNDELLTKKIDLFSWTTTIFDLVVIFSLILLLPLTFYLNQSLLRMIGLCLGIVISQRWKFKSVVLIGILLAVILVIGVISNANSYDSLNLVIDMLTVITVPLITNLLTTRQLELEEHNAELDYQNQKLKRIYADAQKKNKLLENTLESMQNGINVLDKNLNIKYANEKIKNWHGISSSIKGEKCFQAYSNSERPCDECPSLKCIETEQMQRKVFENKNRFPGDYIEIISYPLEDETTEGIRGVVEVCRDITARKKAEKKIEYISFHDELTDLYNRTYLESQMKRLDTVRQLPISIIMIDVNGLKLTNDTFGHEAGDRLLIKAAEVLKTSARDEDIIARFGGDEFTILLPQTKVKDAHIIKERINNACHEISGLEIPLSIALGVAVKEKKDKDLWEVRKQADANMYQNKLQSNKEVKAKIIKALINKLETESAETSAHTLRMQKLSFQLGEKLNLSLHKLARLSSLATLHDIGKIVIGKEILTKPRDLTQTEWEKVKEHAKAGYRITSSTEEFANVAQEILSHHEHWDGSGYPEGLKKDEIPLLARIINIVDAYDVMISGRPYQSAISAQEAKAELKREAGKQFDPDLVEEFLRVI